MHTCEIARTFPFAVRSRATTQLLVPTPVCGGPLLSFASLETQPIHPTHHSPVNTSFRA